jgi:uncharacterized DUF497 family protein
MEFEWDAAKSEACFAERGFDFAYVIRAFLDPDRVARSDARWAYGEDRYQLLGSIEGRVFFGGVHYARSHDSYHICAKGKSTRGK